MGDHNSEVPLCVYEQKVLDLFIGKHYLGLLAILREKHLVAAGDKDSLIRGCMLRNEVYRVVIQQVDLEIV